jgi:hypothetical protein
MAMCTPIVKYKQGCVTIPGRETDVRNSIFVRTENEQRRSKMKVVFTGEDGTTLQGELELPTYVRGFTLAVRLISCASLLIEFHAHVFLDSP